MNPESVRPTPRIPLPAGPNHEVWVFDVTPLEWLRRTWPTRQCPYQYTDAGQIVRRVMPRSGLVKFARLIERLTNYVERDRAAVNEKFRLADEWSHEDVALWLVARTLTEPDTTFVVYNIKPSGRTVMFHRLRAFMSWHPDSPGRA